MALEIETNKKAAVRCAVRVIAILGLNSKVDRALNKQATTPQDKFGAKIGIRILSIDGGGAKGRCALEMCRVIERKTGKKINDLFDLIVGTSTGSIIALGMGALELSIDEVEEAYDTLTKAFRRSQGTNNTYERGWIAGGLEQMSGLYTTGTQNIRALFRGCMYNHELLENFYKRWARVPDSVDDERFCAFSRSMINLAPLGRPRVACLPHKLRQAPGLHSPHLRVPSSLEGALQEGHVSVHECADRCPRSGGLLFLHHVASTESEHRCSALCRGIRAQ